VARKRKTIRGALFTAVAEVAAAKIAAFRLSNSAWPRCLAWAASAIAIPNTCRRPDRTDAIGVIISRRIRAVLRRQPFVEERMRFWLILATSLVGLAGTATAAQAQNYPWCAVYGGNEGAGENCGFSTFAQCMATLSGMGGFCNRNTQYVPPPGPHPGPWRHYD
jgi:Protein of unknown function (DUF3551)